MRPLRAILPCIVRFYCSWRKGINQVSCVILRSCSASIGSPNEGARRWTKPRDLLFHEWPMFNQVMTNEHDICRRLLEVVLGEPVDRVRSVEGGADRRTETGGEACGNAFASTANAVYDVEIQAYDEGAWPANALLSICDSSALRQDQPYRILRSTSYSSALRISSTRRFRVSFPKWFAARIEAVDLRHGFHWVVLNASALETLAEGPLRSLLKYVAAGEEDGDALVG